MKIYINGEQQALSAERSLLHYLPQAEPDKPYAVAVNGDFIPRAQYADIELKDGDEIDVVAPVGGG